MLTEQRKEQIRKEAHTILEKFGKSLTESKISVEEKDMPSSREEDIGKSSDFEFRDRMFVNAPNKTGDFILAEKGDW